MDFQLLLQHISKHISLTNEEEVILKSLLHSKKIKKKHFLLQEGEVNRSATFVTSGILRIYSIDKNGFEHILQFAPPGWISKEDLEKLYAAVPKFERFFRILAENSIASHQQRLVNNLSLSAAERYANFCQLYPSLIQSLPQKQVASYIGVTPEFLSKMLSNLPAKK
ncbi:MAG: Crp/Fnr family transcriptional regulator [Sphingobacteriales bacterium]|nr:Crp/Fnr family transcriptional regulator [Sphingobacteriales bacterium]